MASFGIDMDVIIWRLSNIYKESVGEESLNGYAEWFKDLYGMHPDDAPNPHQELMRIAAIYELGISLAYSDEKNPYKPRSLEFDAFQLGVNFAKKRKIGAPKC